MSIKEFRWSDPGRFGEFGGRYVPETLVPAFERLEAGVREYLADGPRPSKEVMAEAKLLGLSERTLRTAKTMVGVSSQRLGKEGLWNWYLGKPGGSRAA